MPSKRLLLAILGAILLLGGALAVGGVIGTPSVDDVDNTFGEVTDEQTVIETDLIVNNPNPVGIGLDSATVDYVVGMNDIDMANGSVDEVEIERGKTAIPATSNLENLPSPIGGSVTSKPVRKLPSLSMPF